ARSTACAPGRCSKPTCPISPAPPRFRCSPCNPPPRPASKDLPMSRRPLFLAFALALLPAAAQADDLLQSYHNARNSDPQFAAAEANRAIAAERPVQARAALLPNIDGSVGARRAGTSGNTSRTGSWGVSLSRSEERRVGKEWRSSGWTDRFN